MCACVHVWLHVLPLDEVYDWGVLMNCFNTSIHCILHSHPPLPSPPLHTEPPLLWDGPHDVTAASGSKVTLRCRYSGVPTPSIYWYHEDALIAPGDRVCLSAKDGFVSLYIPCLEASAAGEYTCTAVNSVGTVTTQALISVQGELGISTYVCM